MGYFVWAIWVWNWRYNTAYTLWWKQENSFYGYSHGKYQQQWWYLFDCRWGFTATNYGDKSCECHLHYCSARKIWKCKGTNWYTATGKYEVHVQILWWRTWNRKAANPHDTIHNLRVTDSYWNYWLHKPYQYNDYEYFSSQKGIGNFAGNRFVW